MEKTALLSYLLLVLFNQMLRSGESTMIKEESFLRIKLFTGDVIRPNKAIPEDQIKVFAIDRKRDVLEQIKLKLGTDIENLSAFATGMVKPVESNRVAWMGGEFFIQVHFHNGTELEKKKTAKVNINIYDTKKKNSFVKEFSVELNEVGVATIRRDKMALFVAVYPELESEKSKVSHHYHSEFRFEDFTIFSKDASWKELEYSGDEIVFHNAKAVIPTEDRYLTLFGEKIVYQKKENKLSGEAIELFRSTDNDDDEKLIEAKKIIIPLSDPLNFRKIK